jgi:hypothetical protein
MNHVLRNRLIALYADLGRLTETECAGRCERPRTCCEARYCAIAIDHAQTHWQTELAETWHPVLPLMGDDGCTAPPHLRPICTAHTCAVCIHGEKPDDPAWNARYRKLTAAIAAIEHQLLDDTVTQ